LERIIRSLTPTTLIVAGAVIFVLGTGFLLASDATLASSSPGASGDLAQAGRWLQFVAWLCLLGAVCTAGWEAIVGSEWTPGAELAAAALGTLLLTVGFAAIAGSNGSSSAAAVTIAVGIGVWALLVLSRAARVSLTEQGAGPVGPVGPANTATVHGAPVPVPGAHGPGPGAPGRVPGAPVHGGLLRRHQADLWLAAAVGLFALAIGYGFTSAASSAGPGIAAGLLQAVGVAALAWAVVTARSRKMLNSHLVSPVLAGLALLAISFLAGAIVAGLAFGTLAALGVGLTVVTAVELAAVVALGLAAWTRVRELYR
jgi:hypothetical protein